MKFLAIDPRHKKPEHLHALLAAVEDMAATAQLQRVVVPVYTYYWTAYRRCSSAATTSTSRWCA